MDQRAEILSDLTPQQHAATVHMEGPALCVAGAGAGKTTVITRRIAHLIDRGVSARSILVLTFTRAAAQNMRNRAMCFAPEARHATIGTFHSVAARLLRVYATQAGLPREHSVIDPEDVETIINACVARMGGWPKGKNLPQASSWAKVISRAINTRQSPQAVLLELYPQHEEFANRLPELIGAFREYKRQRYLVDFDDLLLYFRALSENKTIGPLLQKRFRYVLVDEHQDSNMLQLQIVYALSGKTQNAFLVGDPAQAIYSFRGSAPATLFNALERWPHAAVYPLETNYRSTAAILNVANAIDLAMINRFDRTLVAARGGGTDDAVTLLTIEDELIQAPLVANQILAEKDRGCPLKEQAILVRSMAQARKIEPALIAARIPYIMKGGVRIDEAAHVKDFLSLVRVSVNPTNEPAWLRILEKVPKIGPKTASAITDFLMAGSGNSADRLQAAKVPRGANLDMLVDALRALDTDGDVSTRLMSAIAKIEPLLAARYEGTWSERKDDLDALASMAGRAPDLSVFLNDLTLDYSFDNKVTGGPDIHQENGGILTLSTIHSAKGLEWGVVHVPSFYDGHIPSGYAIFGTPEDLEEELRVFYVLMTRPKDKGTHPLKAAGFMLDIAVRAATSSRGGVGRGCPA